MLTRQAVAMLLGHTLTSIMRWMSAMFAVMVVQSPNSIWAGLDQSAVSGGQAPALIIATRLLWIRGASSAAILTGACKHASEVRQKSTPKPRP